MPAIDDLTVRILQRGVVHSGTTTFNFDYAKVEGNWEHGVYNSAYVSLWRKLPPLELAVPVGLGA